MMSRWSLNTVDDDKLSWGLPTSINTEFIERAQNVVHADKRLSVVKLASEFWICIGNCYSSHYKLSKNYLYDTCTIIWCMSGGLSWDHGIKAACPRAVAVTCKIQDFFISPPKEKNPVMSNLGIEPRTSAPQPMKRLVFTTRPRTPLRCVNKTNCVSSVD
jgi:hypothetical protein